MTYPHLDQAAPQDCSWVFDRIRVYPVTIGGTRVEWQLHPLFRDPLPHTFQLQVGRTADNAADDWQDVGLPVEDAFYAIDDQQRVYAKTQWTHYRLVLTTPHGTYTSRPAATLGALDWLNWQKWRAHQRMWSINLKRSPGSSLGYILKRRLYGEPCSCLDPQTGEVRKPNDPVCYGTGFVGGYFAPVGGIFADMGLKLTRDHIDDSARGMINDLAVNSQFLAIPQLGEYDIFVEKHTDIRYAVRGVQYEVAQNGVPAVVSCKLMPLGFADIIYHFPIADLVL